MRHGRILRDGENFKGILIIIIFYRMGISRLKIIINETSIDIYVQLIDILTSNIVTTVKGWLT